MMTRAESERIAAHSLAELEALKRGLYDLPIEFAVVGSVLHGLFTLGVTVDLTNVDEADAKKMVKVCMGNAITFLCSENGPKQ